MEITDELLAGLGVNRRWCIHTNDLDDLEAVIGLITKAGSKGLYADMGVTAVSLYVQTLQADAEEWLSHLSFKLSDGPEIGVPGTDLDDLVDKRVSGFEQAHATLARVGELIEAELKCFEERYRPHSVPPRTSETPALVRVELGVREVVKYASSVDVDPEDYELHMPLDLDDPASVKAWVQAWAKDESNWVEEITVGTLGEVAEREHEVLGYTVLSTREVDGEYAFTTP